MLLWGTAHSRSSLHIGVVQDPLFLYLHFHPGDSKLSLLLLVVCSPALDLWLESQLGLILRIFARVCYKCGSSNPLSRNSKFSPNKSLRLFWNLNHYNLYPLSDHPRSSMYFGYLTSDFSASYWLTICRMIFLFYSDPYNWTGTNAVLSGKKMWKVLYKLQLHYKLHHWLTSQR